MKLLKNCVLDLYLLFSHCGNYSNQSIIVFIAAEVDLPLPSQDLNYLFCGVDWRLFIQLSLEFDSYLAQALNFPEKSHRHGFDLDGFVVIYALDELWAVLFDVVQDHLLSLITLLSHESN